MAYVDRLEFASNVVDDEVGYPVIEVEVDMSGVRIPMRFDLDETDAELLNAWNALEAVLKHHAHRRVARALERG